MNGVADPTERRRPSDITGLWTTETSPAAEPGVKGSCGVHQAALEAGARAL
jgi:hypothetical protein